MERSVRELDELARAGTIVMIPWQEILPDARQPRRHFDKTRMDALTGAIKEGSQKLPAVVRPLLGDPNFKFKLVDGERRYRAAKALDQDVPCLVREFRDEDEVLEFQVQANFNRDGHTPMETCNILQRLLESRRFRTLPKKERMAALGRFFGHSELWAWQYLGLRRLHPKLRRLLEPGTPKKKRIPTALAIKLSGFEHAEQMRMYKSIDKLGLNFKRARRFIDRTNLDKGLHTHRKGRRPSDDLEILAGFLGRVGQETAAILDLDDDRFNRMFATRDAAQRKRLMEELDMAVVALDRVRDRTRRAFRAVPAPQMVQ